jgi:hypothetical protein
MPAHIALVGLPHASPERIKVSNSGYNASFDNYNKFLPRRKAHSSYSNCAEGA